MTNYLYLETNCLNHFKPSECVSHSQTARSRKEQGIPEKKLYHCHHHDHDHDHHLYNHHDHHHHNYHDDHHNHHDDNLCGAVEAARSIFLFDRLQARSDRDVRRREMDPAVCRNQLDQNIIVMIMMTIMTITMTIMTIMMTIVMMMMMMIT